MFSQAPLFWAISAANKAAPGAYDNAVSHSKIKRMSLICSTPRSLGLISIRRVSQRRLVTCPDRRMCADGSFTTELSEPSLPTTTATRTSLHSSLNILLITQQSLPLRCRSCKRFEHRVKRRLICRSLPTPLTYP